MTRRSRSSSPMKRRRARRKEAGDDPSGDDPSSDMVARTSVPVRDYEKEQRRMDRVIERRLDNVNREEWLNMCSDNKVHIEEFFHIFRRELKEYQPNYRGVTKQALREYFNEHDRDNNGVLEMFDFRFSGRGTRTKGPCPVTPPPTTPCGPDEDSFCTTICACLGKTLTHVLNMERWSVLYVGFGLLALWWLMCGCGPIFPPVFQGGCEKCGTTFSTTDFSNFESLRWQWTDTEVHVVGDYLAKIKGTDNLEETLVEMLRVVRQKKVQVVRVTKDLERYDASYGTLFTGTGKCSSTTFGFSIDALSSSSVTIKRLQIEQTRLVTWGDDILRRIRDEKQRVASDQDKARTKRDRIDDLKRKLKICTQEQLTIRHTIRDLKIQMTVLTASGKGYPQLWSDYQRCLRERLTLTSRIANDQAELDKEKFKNAAELAYYKATLDVLSKLSELHGDNLNIAIDKLKLRKTYLEGYLKMDVKNLTDDAQAKNAPTMKLIAEGEKDKVTIMLTQIESIRNSDQGAVRICGNPCSIDVFIQYYTKLINDLDGKQNSLETDIKRLRFELDGKVCFAKMNQLGLCAMDPCSEPVVVGINALILKIKNWDITLVQKTTRCSQIQIQISPGPWPEGQGNALGMLNDEYSSNGGQLTQVTTILTNEMCSYRRNECKLKEKRTYCENVKERSAAQRQNIVLQKTTIVSMEEDIQRFASKVCSAVSRTRYVPGVIMYDEPGEPSYGPWNPAGPSISTTKGSIETTTTTTIGDNYPWGV